MKTTLRTALLATAVALAVSGCASMREPSKIESDRFSKIESIQSDARKNKAETCVPVELAKSEVSLELAKHEASEAVEEQSTIEKYIKKAEEAANALAEAAKKCVQPEPVKAPPPPPPPVAKEVAPPPPPPPPPPVVKEVIPPPPAPVVVPVPKVEPPKDTDGDGVVDGSDKCPETPKGAPIDAVGCPRDTDGDTVADYLDKCPDTPKDAPIDAVGCPRDTDGDTVADFLDKCPNTPKGAPIDVRGCPKDTDGDTVFDYMDRCPDTPKGAPIDAQGCPKDTDGDGVADYLDKCPTTPAGVPVEADGCNLKKLSIKLDVQFDTGKAEVKPQYESELLKVADFLKKYSAARGEIEGHTDNVGSAENNKKLSQARADSVRKYLIEKMGVDPSKLTAVGYGLERPIADNKTPEGRQQNRRTEASFTSEVKQ